MANVRGSGCACNVSAYSGVSKVVYNDRFTLEEGGLPLLQIRHLKTLFLFRQHGSRCWPRCREDFCTKSAFADATDVCGKASNAFTSCEPSSSCRSEVMLTSNADALISLIGSSPASSRPGQPTRTLGCTARCWLSLQVNHEPAGTRAASTGLLGHVSRRLRLGPQARAVAECVALLATSPPRPRHVALIRRQFRPCGHWAWLASD